jgi:hypothetical protein
VTPFKLDERQLSTADCSEEVDRPAAFRQRSGRSLPARTAACPASLRPNRSRATASPGPLHGAIACVRRNRGSSRPAGPRGDDDLPNFITFAIIAIIAIIAIFAAFAPFTGMLRAI